MSKTFQQTLEDARYEVSIELYPNDLHYQIFKPECPDRHCWEVYLNPRSESEHDLAGNCETLEEAMFVVEDNLESWQVLGDKSFNDLNAAALAVCEACIHTLNRPNGYCTTCPVRNTVKVQEERRSKL